MSNPILTRQNVWRNVADTFPMTKLLITAANRIWILLGVIYERENTKHKWKLLNAKFYHSLNLVSDLFKILPHCKRYITIIIIVVVVVVVNVIVIIIIIIIIIVVVNLFIVDDKITIKNIFTNVDIYCRT